MAKFNTPTVRPAVTNPITTVGPAATALGAAGHARDAQSELYLLGVSLLNYGKDTFHERGDDRTDRFNALVRQLAVTDPEWTLGFLGWLRRDGNVRTASLVGAAEFVAARKGMDDPDKYNSRVIDAVLQRGDEPGEMLAYWASRYGMALPKGLKKGVGFAAVRLYDEYALAKYDRDASAFRFGRILDLVHPVTTDPTQRALFAYALDDMHGHAGELPAELALLRARAELTTIPVGQRRAILAGPDGADRLRAAGMTWEAVAGWLNGPLDAAAWSALAPTMGYFALLRNLRNLDDAQVSDEVAERVGKRLADPAQVAKSRLFPFRFYAAYKAVQSLRWGHYLERALNASLANVPALPGRTLVLVDQSPSMFPGYYFSTPQQDKEIANADLAKLFGAAVALRAADARLVGYGQTNYAVPFSRGDALLKVMERFTGRDGTDTFQAVADHFDGHDRVVIVTDEQNQTGRYSSIDQVVPREVPVYVWNIGGLKVGSTASTGTRHTWGGLTDAGFRVVSLLESRRPGAWPWTVGPQG
jgi:hypothetical protein